MKASVEAALLTDSRAASAARGGPACGAPGSSEGAASAAAAGAAIHRPSLSVASVPSRLAKGGNLRSRARRHVHVMFFSHCSALHSQAPSRAKCNWHLLGQRISDHSGALACQSLSGCPGTECAAGRTQTRTQPARRR